MTPAEEHAAGVEIAHGECRGPVRPYRSQVEIGVEQDTDTEDDIVDSHERTRTVIDIVHTVIDIVVQQGQGNEDIHGSSQDQDGTVEF